MRNGSRWLLRLAVVAAVLTLPYVLVDDEPEPLDDAVRATVDGRFVRLSAGQTRYEVAGPADGPTVVLVHGTTMPAFVWDRNVAALAEAGRRVLRYDLFGRGFSDRPDVPYDLDLHVGQLDELLAHAAPVQRVDLVGFSIGAVIVSEFARRHPARVGRVVLIGPAGIDTALPLAARLAMAPGVGEYLMRVAGTRQLRPSRRMVFQPERHGDLDATYLPTIRFRGSRRAVLETVRRMPYNGYEAGYRELGTLAKPVLLVWGRHDRVVPFANSERLRQLVGATDVVAVDEAGHLAQWERPEVVNAALRRFLTES